MARNVQRRSRGASSSAEDHFQPDTTSDGWSDDSGDIGEEVDISEASISAGGWGANEVYRQKTRTGVQRIKIGEDETVVVRCLDDAPFASYISRYFKKINRGFVALEKNDPLEGLGEDGRAFSAFNVVPLASDKPDSAYNALEGPDVYVLQASPTLTDEMKRIAQSKRGPLNRAGQYLEISYMLKSNGYGEYKVNAISESDLSDVWEVDPLSESEEKEAMANCYTSEEFPRRHSREEMEAAAAELRSKMGISGDSNRRSRG